MDVELTYLAAGLALGKLSDEDRARALDLLDSDPEFRVLAREFDDAVPGDAHVKTSPPADAPSPTSGHASQDPSMGEARHRRSESTPQDVGESSVSQSDQPRDHALENAEIRARRGEGASWLWAAVAAITVLTSVTSTMALWNERLSSSEEIKEAEYDADAFAALLSAPDLETVTVDATGDLAFRVFSSDEEENVSIELLGDTPDGRAAQAWVTNDGSTSDAGVVHGYDPFLVVRNFRSGDVLTVTIEPLRGSPSPTTEPIVSIEL